jgi:hypothetical protein
VADFFAATVILDQSSLLLYTYYRLILHLPIVIIVAREKLALSTRDKFSYRPTLSVPAMDLALLS